MLTSLEPAPSLARDISRHASREVPVVRKPLTILSSTATGVIVPHSLDDIHGTLRDLGHRVYVQDIAVIPDPRQGIVAIADGVVRVRPDAILTVDRVALLPSLFSALADPPRVISWFYDDPVSLLNREYLCINSHYHIFCWDRAYLPPLRSAGFRNVYYQPFATNPDVNRPLADGDYRYDVSFVGSYSAKRRAILTGLSEQGIVVDVFGDERWREFATRCLRYHGLASNRADCPRIYSQSRINLNISNAQLLTSLPVRVFDVLACAGFLLTDDKADALTLLVPGRELAVYRSTGELAARIRFFLEHPEERDRIRRAGCARVRSTNTFAAVLPGMLETAFAEEPDLASNRPVNDCKMAQLLWLTGLSYLKFGMYRHAYVRLMDALAMKNDQENIHLALAVLANHTRQVAAVKTCMAALAGLGSEHARAESELVKCTEEGIRVRWWDRLYEPYLRGSVLKEDGTVVNWTPVRL